ncbi:unnamed protein product [Periconia digitata]|uniref:Uncharacterized protein n=1 Tax=Periconia digitata TaxID=1303443 RepID=A0A9W4XJ05_9PLEO|nr:unnamed protein product [Periconia digitata]
MAPYIEEEREGSNTNVSDGVPYIDNPELDGNGTEPIAIIGFSFKFPDDGDTPEGFWNMLLEQRYAAREFPADRVNVNGHYRKENRHNTIPMRGGNFLKDSIAAFDADFFNISPAEANALDPMQQRLLEVSYHAFENAGIPAESVAYSETSVYTGCFTHDYLLQTIKDTDDLPTYGAYGMGAAMLANRISHFYNLMGPSIAVDSACSSSAMALDFAVQSLRTRSSSMSLVAGSNLLFGPETFAMLSNLNMLSKDSRSYSFDSRANGYSRGEGIAVMLVKRLDDAIRDGNTIRAVIRATGANEDGKTPGITQPSQDAQQLLIKQTYEKAGLSRSLTRYCEAHGTGTPLGDPLESGAIGNCFRDYRSDTEPMYIGSVKSNIGHTEGASGLAGVIKAVFALENGIIPPNADFREINPRIDTDYLRIKIPTEPTPWPTEGLRRASVNSFGYGGANCHIVLDDAYNFLRLRGIVGKHKTAICPPGAESPINDLSEEDVSIVENPPKLIVISASDAGGAQRLTNSYGPYLMKKFFDGTADTEFFNSLVYTLDSHRSRLSYRTSIIAQSIEDLMEIGSELPPSRRARSTSLQLGFVFTGQGAQWHAMGRELLAYPIYRKSIEEASAHLNAMGCPWSAMDELRRSKEESKIDDPEYSQTLCTVVQVALVDLLNTVNIKPSAVVGHSSGEIGAAYAGRYISKQNAWKIAYQRGVVAAKLTRSTEHGSGAMMAVGLSNEDVQPHLNGVLEKCKAEIGLRVACVNSPTSTTIAGDEHLIDALLSHLNDQDTGIFARKLRVQVAYHSPQMQAVSNEYLESLGSLLKNAPTADTVPMISSVTGKLVEEKEVCNAEYWVANMVSPVLFSPAVMEMCSSKGFVDFLVELGPHSALEGPLREILKSKGMKPDVGYNSILKRNKPADMTLLHAVGNLWCDNYDVDIRRINELEAEQPVSRDMLIDLPAYEFDHSHKYWHESRLSKTYRLRNHLPHDYLGTRCVDWSPLDARWRLLLRVRDLPWIADHIVDNRKIYPGTGMLVMAIEAAKELADRQRKVLGFAIRDVDLSSAMELEGATEVLEVITSLKPRDRAGRDASVYDFDIISNTNPDWVRNVKGSIEIEYEEEEKWNAIQRNRFVEALTLRHQKDREECTEAVDEAHMYKKLKEWGLDYGPSFQRAREQFVSKDAAVADILTLKDEQYEPQPHIVHPATLDAIGHLCFTAYSAGGTKAIATAMPSTIEYAWISAHGLSAPNAKSVHTCSKIVKHTPRGFQAEVTGVSPSDANELCVYMKGCTMAFISEVRKDASQVELPNSAQQWFNILRKVDLSMLSWAEIEQYLLQHCGESAKPLDLACKYIELAAHQNPGLHVLQVGANTEDQTQHIFDSALDQEGSGVLSCASYDFLEGNEQTLTNIKASFARYGNKLSFYNSSSAEKSKQYEIVVALDIGQAQEEIDAVKNSLKFDGKLVVRSSVQETNVLSGLLSQHGFSGPTLTFKSHVDIENDIMIYTLAAQHCFAPRDSQRRVVFVGDFTNENHTSLVNEVSSQLVENKQYEIIRKSFVEASKDTEIKDSFMILLSDPGHLCMESMTEDSFSALQNIVSASTKLLWISDKGAEKLIGGSPVSTIMEGAARTLRMENSSLHMVLLTLESFGEKSARHVLPVLESMASRPTGSNYEQDYFEIDGRLYTDRLINSNHLKEAANARLESQYTETVKVADHDFKLEISQFAKLDTLHYVENSAEKQQLQKDEVDVRVSAIAIDSRDYKKAMGKGKNKHPRYSNMCAGVVTDTNHNGRFNVGDRVLVMGKNCFKSQVRTLDSHIFRLPNTIDPTQACERIPALMAMHYALTELGRWRQGDSVLLYSCTGILGEAAIQVCQQIGAKVCATVHSGEQSNKLYEKYQVPKTSIYSHQTFGIGYRPGFGGADVIICLDSPEDHLDWKFANKFARVVQVPSVSALSSGPPALQLPANITFSFLNFRQVVTERPHLLRNSFSSAIEFISNYPDRNPVAKFSVSRVVEAFQHVSDGKNHAVINLKPGDEITLTRNTKSKLHLDPNATYVISGGTGGIGRSMTRWCAERGARNLILLSRSGAKSEVAQELVSSLTAQGVNVEAPACDTANEGTLRAVLDDCLLRMPPIKGCMQASGAYKDLTFDRYDLEGWNTAIKSKATSSWNLHKLLPAGMDFFIMLSSVSPILGAISMSSYAGANSYQDGLARYRIEMGEKATAFNPGILHDIGFVTEFTDAQRDRLDRVGYFIPTWEAEINALLDIFCNPESPMTSVSQQRPIVGMNTVAQMEANGSEVPFEFRQPLWQHTLYTPAINTDESSANNQTDDVKTGIVNAESLDQAAVIATSALRKHLAVLLSTQEERVQDGTTVDSLIAIELRNWIGKTFSADVPVFEIVSASTWGALGTSIAEQVRETS